MPSVHSNSIFHEAIGQNSAISLHWRESKLHVASRTRYPAQHYSYQGVGLVYQDPAE